MTIEMGSIIQFWRILLLFGLIPIVETHAQRSLHSRPYAIDGSYAGTVTLSPQGHVITRSGDTPAITLLDGYSRKEVAAPEESNFRVYESRVGQLWTLYSGGILMQNRGTWQYHPISEIQNELQNNPMRQFRQLSLLPAEVDHVLILLPDRLLEYDAGNRTVTLLRHVSRTALGRFSEMVEALDGGAWISGRNGIAKIPGPIRRLSPDSRWEEFPLQNTPAMTSLQRPYENVGGIVTTVGNSAEENSSRYVLELTSNGWRSFNLFNEKARQAWRSWDNTLWAYSYNSLFRVRAGEQSGIIREPVLGSQFDVAVETNGVFWIASAEGVVRYASYLWRPKPDLEFLQSPVHAVLEATNRSSIWLATGEGLISWSTNGVFTQPWPDDLELTFAPSDNLYCAPNGLIIPNSGNRVVGFDPATRQFQAVSAPPGFVRFVGTLNDSTLCASIAIHPSSNLVSFASFDGRTFTPMDIPGIQVPAGEVTLLEQTSNLDIWIGTESGLLVIRAADHSLESYGHEQGLLTGRTLSFAEVGEGRFWCGTPTDIFELKGQRWELVYRGTDKVNAIERGTEGSVWVATSGGMLRYENETWISYGPAEGLFGVTVYSVKRDRSDRVWAGTSRGAVLYYPEADPDPPQTLPPVLLQPQTPSTAEPTVISFRGVDKWNYCLPQDLLYSYRLDEGSWSPFSNAVSRAFQNLSSGEHVIEVRAMDKNSNRSIDASSMTFSVIVPWFRDPRLLIVSLVGVGAILFFAAVAVKKHLALKHSYAEVGKIVAQRTRELERANQELLHSQKMRAIGTMAAGVAHDFNNILSIIKGSAQIIEDNLEDKNKIHTRVSRIQTVVEQGTSIVKALLGLGRFNEKELVECDPGVILEDTRKLLSDRFPASASLIIETPPEIPKITCSKEVLHQMLLNLVLNSLDAIGNEGEIRLRAQSINEEFVLRSGVVVLEPAKSPRYVLLSVLDDGCGVPAENLSRIFEPFYTTKAFSSRRGTGLGLSMVYELAKGMGYGLAAESQIGGGSNFSIIIPVQSPSPA